MGIFISEDQIKRISDLNVYRYAMNNATNYIDSFGLQSEMKMPGERPEAKCCNRGKILDRIIREEEIITAMDNGIPPTALGEGIEGSIFIPADYDPKTGWFTPWERDVSEFHPWGCNDPDPCLSYCCRVHEWTHFTDYRPYNMSWGDARIDIFGEMPAYQGGKKCLESFL